MDVNTSGHRLIVNITSLAAIQPFKSFGFYCIGKAAREMYLRTLAEENKDLDILNYSPGPVGTDMIDRVIKGIKDEDVRNSFIAMRDNKTLVKLEDTVGKLIDVLEHSKYTSGGRIDYFDR
uniref:Sepiapterin reductase n=1 Tax=Triatoma infestans TaxID=30076 RepID=A0A161MAN5_TRIIF